MMGGRDIWRYISAYGTALKHGFRGTEEEWLASLKGEKGDKGDKGDTGEKGDTGAGFPIGGSSGSVFRKASATDYDTTWDTVDNRPTMWSEHLVTSGGVFAAIDELVPRDGSKHMLGNLNMFNHKVCGLSSPTEINDAATKQYVDTGLAGKQNTLTFDTAPTALSTNPVTSGGIKTALDGLYIHAGKKSGTTLGTNATAEGYLTTASGDQSHSEGSGTTASGFAAHAEGGSTIASGVDSHAEGGSTIANHKAQHVFGEFNVADTSTANENTRGNYVEIVGNGTEDYRRSNARTLDWDGNEVLAGKLTLGAAPTANMDAATKKYVDDAVAGAGADGDAVVIDKSDNASEDYAAIRSVLSAGKTVILRVEPPAGRYNTGAYWYLPLAFWQPQKSSTTVELLDFCGLVNDHEAARITLTGVRATNYGNWSPLSTAVLCKAADGYLKADGSVAMTGGLPMGGNRITGLGAPTANTDAATKKYVDDAVTAAVGAAIGGSY